jgi:hypothetical protein
VARLKKVKRGRKPRGFPSHVNLFGCKVRIIYCHVMPKDYTDCFGVTFYDERDIYLSINQSKEEMERTLFHEICHMLLFLSGHSYKLKEDDEEALIRAFEHGFLQMYKRRRL